MGVYGLAFLLERGLMSCDQELICFDHGLLFSLCVDPGVDENDCVMDGSLDDDLGFVYLTCNFQAKFASPVPCTK